MSRRADERLTAWFNWIGLLILLVCYAAALVNVARRRHEETTHDVIRITHWQLELGVRDGLNELIRRFEELKAREGRPVKVVQIPVTERAYAQYITTQMVGGTAPDLVELGMFPREFYGRYFLPLSAPLQAPNPHIARRLREWEAQGESLTPAERRLAEAHRELANLKWMDTFTDGLRSLYNEELQEYFGVGFSQFTIRLFYNKDLYRRVIGRETPPATYRQLLEDCERIEAWNRERGDRLIPIASSRYQMNILRSRYLTALTADLFRQFDANADAWSWRVELLAATLRGDWPVDHPRHRASMQALSNLARYFPRGFMSLDRMDAGFAFVQGRAAMITSGSWDAQSFLKNIADQPPERRFEVGIFDFPPVAPDDPEFGRYYAGRASEANTGTNFAFGITRYTKHLDLCIEFLQFCTTPEANEILNRHAEWIPSVRGAAASEFLEAFQPNFAGYYEFTSFDFGSRTGVLYEQLFWPFISGEMDFDTFARRLDEQLPTAAAVDFIRSYRGQAEALPGRRARRVTYLADMAFGDANRSAEATRRLLRAWDGLAPVELGQAAYECLIEDALREAARRGLRTRFNEVFLNEIRRELGAGPWQN